MIQPKIESFLKKTPILPVVVLDRAEDAVPMARALMAGGIFNVEITLRTAAALPGLAMLRDACPDMTLGAGTVFTAEQVEDAIQAGASYIVSPGFSKDVHKACLKAEIDYLPGAVTPTEMQKAQGYGYRFLKFFPAEAYGGIKTLKALAPVFQDIKFCATGGVAFDNVKDYLAQPNIIGVGMSAIVPKAALDAKNWAGITERAREASGMFKKVG